MENLIKNKIILVTGGTGSIGRELVKQLLKFEPKQIRIFSRDQSKQLFLQHELGNNDIVRYFIGDIRDKERVELAVENVDIIFHAAALKHVVSCEYNPFEAIKTNINGLQNVIESALKNNVERFVYISTDKAVEPSNIMGSTKSLGEKLVSNAYYYKGKKRTIFSSVRFGNVLNSEGSVLQIWKKQIEKGNEITITEPEMRRFFMSIPQAAQLVLHALNYTQVNEIFVLKMPVMRVMDLADVLIDELTSKYGRRKEDIKIKFIGKGDGERMHEKLMTEEEAERAIETQEFFIVRPPLLIPYKKEHITPYLLPNGLKMQKEIKGYSTENSKILDKDEIRALLIKEGLI